MYGCQEQRAPLRTSPSPYLQIQCDHINRVESASDHSFLKSLMNKPSLTLLTVSVGTERLGASLSCDLPAERFLPSVL